MHYKHIKNIRLKIKIKKKKKRYQYYAVAGCVTVISMS